MVDKIIGTVTLVGVTGLWLASTSGALLWYAAYLPTLWWNHGK